MEERGFGIPRINVEFILTGDEFSKEIIWERLGLEPTEFRTKKDWPRPILEWQVYNPDLSEELRPRTVWSLETGYEKCEVVSYQFRKIIEKLKGKEEAILQLCKELDLRRPLFVIGIKEEDGYFPVMSLEKEDLAFLARLGADIAFDIGDNTIEDFYELLDLTKEIVVSNNLQEDKKARVITALSACGNVYHKIVQDPYIEEEQLLAAKSFTDELIQNQDTELDKIICLDVNGGDSGVDVLPVHFRELIYTTNMRNSKTKILLQGMNYIVKELWQTFPPFV